MIGIANKTLSKRSKTPPCPGKTLPESLTPNDLFNKDSTKSPNGANIAINIDKLKVFIKSNASKYVPKYTTTSIQPRKPAIAPSMLFLGLTA